MRTLKAIRSDIASIDLALRTLDFQRWNNTIACDVYDFERAPLRDRMRELNIELNARKSAIRAQRLTWKGNNR